MKTPRVRFCWDCGRQLWGKHHFEMVIDGHQRILHKSCARESYPMKYKKIMVMQKQTKIDGRRKPL